MTTQAEQRGLEHDHAAQCPHCGAQLLVRIVRSPAPQAELNHLGGRPNLWPLVTAVRQRLVAFLAGGVKAPDDAVTKASGYQKRYVIIGLLCLALAVFVLWSAAPLLEAFRSPPASGQSVAVPTPTIQPDAERAAIIDTLSQFNRAETEAAALLTIEPLSPFIDPTSDFAARKAAQLAARRDTNAPHRAMLTHWAIGEITVTGDTATAVTQETWTDQAVGAVGPEQTTVRVTYSLRRDSTSGRWLIVDTSQLRL